MHSGSAKKGEQNALKPRPKRAPRGASASDKAWMRKFDYQLSDGEGEGLRALEFERWNDFQVLSP